MATAALTVENTMETEENQAEETFSDGINIDSFIDEEFTNLFDSGSDLEDPLFVEDRVTRSSSSMILAQQLKKLNESCNTNDMMASTEGKNISIAPNEDLDDVSDARSQFCENCQRLQITNRSSSDDDSVNEPGDPFFNRFGLF